jgi:predicted outer membrane repeat protein
MNHIHFFLDGGGSIYNLGASMTISDTTFSGCSCSSGDGGVIHCVGGNNSFHSSTFLYCSAGGFGGTIYLHEVGVTCTNCSWLNCFSGDGGGAIAHCDDPDPTNSLLTSSISLTECKFESCSTGKEGGALNINYVSLNAIRCSFLHNSAGHNGGGIYVRHRGSFMLEKTTFGYNVNFNEGDCGLLGGAILMLKSGSIGLIKVESCIFLTNSVIKSCTSGMFIFIYFFFYLC